MKSNFSVKTLGAGTKLSLLAGINRPIYPRQVTKLAQSIDKMGVVRPIVVSYISFITGKKELYIIDGQHLYHALIRNNYDFPCVFIDIKDKQDLVEKIALLNASSKNWCIRDYITAWSSMIHDYVKLNHYLEGYDIDVSTIASILSESSNGGGFTTRLKRGAFRIVNEEKNVQILDFVTDMLKVVPRMNRADNNYATNEYIKFIKNIGLSDYKRQHKQFIEKLHRNKDKFIIATQEEDKLMELLRRLI